MKNNTAFAGMPAYVRLLLAGGALAALAVATPAYAAGTQAGKPITNQARATYDNPDPEEDPIEVPSNEVTIIVDEILDVDVAWADDPNVDVESPSEKQILEFTVTNAGNGPEKFDLSFDVPSGDFDPDVVGIYLDTNGNGTYEEGDDALYSSDIPTILADGHVTVFVVADIPGGLAETDLGHVDLTATAQTGSGPAGTVFTVEGEDYSAVAGMTTAQDTARGTYEVGYATPPPTPISVNLLKTGVVKDRWNGLLAIPGSTITYTLTASIAGDGTANKLVITDEIPAGTIYVYGSLKLDEDALSDAPNDDAGEADGSSIAVDLDDVESPATHTITFQVTIDEED